MLEDDMLVRRFKGKDLQAFDEIFTIYYKPIYFFIYKMVYNVDTAEDITQDTFVKVFKGLSKVETDIKLSPWIYRIAHNACIDHIRKHKITFELLDNVNYENDIKDIKGDDNPEVNYINIELRDKINKVMMRLNNRYKTVLILRDYNDLSYKNIAEILGLSEAGIKSLIHRARQEFQKIFKEMSNNEL